MRFAAPARRSRLVERPPGALRGPELRRGGVGIRLERLRALDRLGVGLGAPGLLVDGVSEAETGVVLVERRRERSDGLLLARAAAVERPDVLGELRPAVRPGP